MLPSEINNIFIREQMVRQIEEACSKVVDRVRERRAAKIRDFLAEESKRVEDMDDG